jgi:hypothetical protein
MLSGLNTRRQETPHFSGPDPDYSPRSTPSDRTQPSVLGIRKTPPSRADLDTTTVLKFARTEASGTRNRLCISDFDAISQSVLKRALSHYRAELNNNSPFPDQLEDRKASTNAWLQACTELTVHIEFDEELLKLVMSISFYVPF